MILNIKNNISANELAIGKSDKGKTIVILTREE
jgi:hypothetical protein